jgi:hypothetical protein
VAAHQRAAAMKSLFGLALLAVILLALWMGV